ncbi:hypothetical protein KSF78_0003090 [Schistosoma japonicum]|nr:hypothetical protein KSF78_0003090 [Schistosoma japonicum]KAH8864942.1 hypothetical protein KSF78_0003090 [Schistosoma japonicum]
MFFLILLSSVKDCPFLVNFKTTIHYKYVNLHITTCCMTLIFLFILLSQDNNMTSNIATHVSTGVLGLLFILPGIVKTVRLNTTLYREMLKTFKNFTEVSPLRHIGVIPSPQIYMQSMGVFELLLGTTLIVGHVSFKKFACLGIMALMMLTTYCQVALKDYSAGAGTVDLDEESTNTFSNKELRVIQLYNHLSFIPPTFFLWCCAAMLFPKTDENFAENASNDSSLSADFQDQLDTLITVGNYLFSGLDDSSRYKPYLYNYLKEARRVIMHLYLELFAPTNDYTLCFSKLNQYLPASDSTAEVQDFRLRFVKLLASERKVDRYLNERWLPAKSNVFRKLQSLAFDIAGQLPEVLLDKVGSSKWVYNDGILLGLNTLLALVIRQQLLYKSSCTEEDVFEIIHAYNSQSCPSQLL